MPICYLNGKFLALEDARVSVLDRGFIFGDGVYEVVPVFNGKPLRLAAHLARLQRSLRAVGIRDPLSREAWTRVITRLIRENAGADQSVYLHVTRGAAPRNHAPPPDLAPTVFAMSDSIDADPNPPPVDVITMPDIRWTRCDIKAISLLPNVMFRSWAQRAGAYEAVLLRDGQVTEGAASNVFIVHDEQIKTPPQSNHLLPGVTRDLLIEILAKTEYAVRETAISESALAAATEVWLTSSTREILPVRAIDGRVVGDGTTGMVTARVREIYTRYKRSL